MEIDRARAVELFAAAQIGDVEQVQTLLPPCGDCAEDGTAAATGGVTPLMAAARADWSSSGDPARKFSGA
jgi:hypothetical protein